MAGFWQRHHYIFFIIYGNELFSKTCSSLQQGRDVSQLCWSRVLCYASHNHLSAAIDRTVTYSHTNVDYSAQVAMWGVTWNLPKRGHQAKCQDFTIIEDSNRGRRPSLHQRPNLHQFWLWALEIRNRVMFPLWKFFSVKIWRFLKRMQKTMSL